MSETAKVRSTARKENIESSTRTTRSKNPKPGKDLVQEGVNGRHKGDAEVMNNGAREAGHLRPIKKQPQTSTANKKAATSVETNQNQPEGVHATEERIFDPEIVNEAAAGLSAATRAAQRGAKRVSEQKVNDKLPKKGRGRPPKDPEPVIDDEHPPTATASTGQQLRRSKRLHEDTEPASTSIDSNGAAKSPGRSTKRRKVSASRTRKPAAPKQQADRAPETQPELESEEADTAKEPVGVDEGEDEPSRSTSRAPPAEQIEDQIEKDIPQADEDAVVENDPDWQEHDENDAQAEDSDDQGTQSGLRDVWYTKLGRVFKEVKAITSARPKLRTKSAKTLVEALEQFQDQVVASNSPFLLLDDNRDSENHPPEQLAMVVSWRKIYTMAAELRRETGFDITHDLYGRVIPAMTLILHTVLAKFGRRAIFKEEHYYTLLGVIKVIVSLGNYGTALRQQNSQDRVDDSDKRKEHRKLTELAIINPVKNGVLAPIRKVQSILEKVLRRQTSTTQAAARQLETLATRRRAQDRDRRAAERDAILAPWRKSWTTLHNVRATARMQAEKNGGFRASWHYLMPVPPSKRDTTADQVADMIPELNYREGMNEEAWAEAGGELLVACQKYLQSDEDEDDLWIAIIWDLCQPTDEGRKKRIPPPLLEFSVTEIVSRVIFARDQLLASDRWDEENKAWLRRIWDPRVRPRLPGDEVVGDVIPEVIEIEDGDDDDDDEGVGEDAQLEDEDQDGDDGQEAANDGQEAEDDQDEDEEQAEDGIVED